MITKKTSLFLAYSLAAMLFYSPAILAYKKSCNMHALESEGQMLLTSYNDQKNQSSLSAEAIAGILTAADSVKAITEKSTADDFRTLWPTTGDNAFTKILADNNVTTLQDFKAKILDPYRLNAHIQQWITKFNKSIFTPKSREFKTLAHSLTQAATGTSREEDQAIVNLYSIFFRAYAVRTLDALAKVTQTPEITKALTGRGIEDLFKRFKITPATRQTNLAKKHSNIFAEPIVHDLNITDPDTANSILMPLYASQPIEDLQCISTELEAIAGKNQKLLKKADLAVMNISLHAQQLNKIIQRPATYMNEALANVSQEILEQLLHGITLMNDTINNVSQNVGPYKKASDALAANAEPALKALTDVKQTFNDLIKKLTEDSKSTQQANTETRKPVKHSSPTPPAPTPAAPSMAPEPTPVLPTPTPPPAPAPTPVLPTTTSTPPELLSTTTPAPAITPPATPSLTPNPVKPAPTTTSPTSTATTSTSMNTGTSPQENAATTETAATYNPTIPPAGPRPSGPFGGPSSTPQAPTPPTLGTSSASAASLAAATPPVSTLNTGTPTQNSSNISAPAAPTSSASTGGI